MIHRTIIYLYEPKQEDIENQKVFCLFVRTSIIMLLILNENKLFNYVHKFTLVRSNLPENMSYLLPPVATHKIQSSCDILTLT